MGGNGGVNVCVLTHLLDSKITVIDLNILGMMNDAQDYIVSVVFIRFFVADCWVEAAHI